MPLKTFLNHLRQRFPDRTVRNGRTSGRLRVMRLEDRRLLDAAFGISALGILTLDGFDAHDTLTINGGIDSFSNPTGTSSSLTLANGVWDSGLDLHGGDFSLSNGGRTLSLNTTDVISGLQIDGSATGGGRLDFLMSGGDGIQVSDLNVTNVDFVMLTDSQNDFDTLSVDIGRLYLVDQDDIRIDHLETERRAHLISLNGDIEDAPGTTIAVGHRGLFQAHNITLGDHTADSTNFNALKFTATGDVDITEDSAMRIVESSSGDNVTLTSSGTLWVEDNVILTGNRLDLSSSAGVHFQADSVLHIDIDGETQVVDYDVVQTSAPLTLSGSLFVDSSDTFADGTEFTILENSHSDAVQGTFVGLEEGDVVTGSNGQQFVISYVGGDGNDVVLYAGTPTYSFADSQTEIDEGSDLGMTSAAGTVIRSGNTAIASSVDVVIDNGTADDGDFTAQTLTLNFAAGQTTATFAVQVTADTIVEADETIELSLSGFTSGGSADGHGAAVITIVNDDTARLSIADLTVNEDVGTASFTVTSSNVSQGDLMFSVVAMGSGTFAASSSDGTLLDSTGTIDGDSLTMSTTVTVAIADDLRVEGSETFLMSLFAATFSGTADAGRVVILDGHAVGTIVDNDTASLSFATAAGSVNEDDVLMTVDVALTIHASGDTGVAGLDRVVSVEVNHTSGTATETGVDADFTYIDTTLSFGPGNGATFEQTVDILIREDILDDDSETVVLSLQNLADGTQGNSVGQVSIQPHADFTLTINDDDGDTASGTAVFDLVVGGGDVRICNHNGQLEVWVNDVLQSTRPFEEVDTLVINGTADSESVLLDFSHGAFTSNIIVNGEGGNDVLRIIGPVTRSSISFDGGAGDDTIYLEGKVGGSDFDVTYDGFADSESGTVLIDHAALLDFSEVENHSLNITGISDLVLNFAGGDSNIVFTRIDATQTQVTGDSFTTTNFTNPADSFTINFTDANDYNVEFVGFGDDFHPADGVFINGNLAGGEIDLVVQDLGSFTGDLEIDLGGGSDSVLFQNTDQVFNSLSVVAESVTATSALDVSGVTIVDAGPDGSITLQNAANEFDGPVQLTAENVLLKAATSVMATVTAQHLDIDSAGDLTISSTAGLELTDLDADQSALTADNIMLSVNGDLTQTADAAISTADLAIQQLAASGDVLLSAADNDVDVIAVSNAADSGAVVFFDVDELHIGSVGTVDGIDTNAGDINVTSDGDLVVDQEINAAHAVSTVSTDESITLISRNGNFTLTDGITITSDENPASGMSDDITDDQLQIIAGSVSGTGIVTLGMNSELRTDGGVARQLAPRPTAFAVAPTVGSDNAFVTLSDAESMRSNLISLNDQFLGFIDLFFGVTGEENLQVVIDWGTFRQTEVSLADPAGDAAPSAAVPGAFEFGLSDADRTFFTIDSGGNRYLIPHLYDAIDLIQTTSDRNGRQANPGLFGVRFSVAQHSSIQVFGDSVTDPTTSSQETPEDFSAENPVAPVFDARGAAISLPGSGLALLSSTDPNPLSEFRQQAAPLPFDNDVVTSTGRPEGLAEWEFLTSKTPGIVIVVLTPLPPLEIPRIDAPVPTLIASRVGGDLSFGDGAASDSGVGTDVYLQIRRVFELDAAAEVVMARISNSEFISNREHFEEFVAQNPELQDGAGYEVWLITETDGQRVERPIVKFDITGGRPGPATEELPETFEPYELKELEFQQPEDVVPHRDIPDRDDTAPANDDSTSSVSPGLPSSSPVPVFDEPESGVSALAAGTVLLPSFAFTKAARWKRRQHTLSVHSPSK